MFMSLWRTVRKIVLDMVDAVAEGKLYQILLRKNLLHLAAEGLVHAIVVICIQKPPFSR